MRRRWLPRQHQQLATYPGLAGGPTQCTVNRHSNARRSLTLRCKRSARKRRLRPLQHWRSAAGRARSSRRCRAGDHRCHLPSCPSWNRALVPLQMRPHLLQARMLQKVFSQRRVHRCSSRRHRQTVGAWPKRRRLEQRSKLSTSSSSNSRALRACANAWELALVVDSNGAVPRHQSFRGHRARKPQPDGRVPKFRSRNRENSQLRGGRPRGCPVTILSDSVTEKG
mmetsp:Transcript_27497/g.70010  ORF Transcript_27497/g.70010 Transcript_27497/m.70010 type:complete len:225 (+) Transcript_27497:403-1077(+)